MKISLALEHPPRLCAGCALLISCVAAQWLMRDGGLEASRDHVSIKAFSRVCNHYTLQAMIWAVQRHSCTTSIAVCQTSPHVLILIYRVRPQARVPVENPQELKAGERAYPLAKAMPASAVAGFADSPRQLSEIAASCAG